MNENGLVDCFICKLEYPWSIITNGHFRKRRHMATRWDEKNCNPLCVFCNNEDDDKKYEVALELKYGYGTPEKLKKLSNTEVHFTREELEEKIKYYEDKIASFE